MSFALLDRFRKDPVGIAASLPLISFDQEQRSDATILKQKGGSNELFSLRGDTRIAALDLTDQAGGLKMSVDWKTPATKFAAGQDWMPFYFLPWIKNAIVRTTLRPRSQTTRAGVAKANITQFQASPKYHVNQNDPLSPVLDPNDPDVFITSAVNGCTVSVRGSREEPTVYHGNAIDIAAGGSKSPVELAAHFGREADAAGLITLKVDDMKRMLAALDAADPKADRLPGAHTPTQARMLSQSSYQMLAMQGKIATGHMADADRVIRGVAADEGFRKNKANRVRLVSSQGTVFGIRTNGLWTFYYQKLVIYEIWRDTAGMFKKANWQRDQGIPRRYRLVDSGEFWPTGAGFVVP